jgi:signal transduction histidine kinase
MMPNLDGWDLCRMIRQHPLEEIRGIGNLMLTARALPEDRVYGLEIGADDYLTKPFSLQELALRIEKLSEKHQAVSLLKEEMKSLQASTQKKETDLRKVVHDLKNPLLSMGASAKRMLRRNPNQEELKMLQTIYDGSLRLTGWIDDTLSSKEIESEIKEVDIRSMIQQVIALLKGMSTEKKVGIHFEVSSSIPPIHCHPQTMFRVIENLLNNALKYTPAGGKVDVTVTSYLEWKDTGIVEISVKDTGIGIFEEEIERIFEPFYRGRNSTA